ncbi:CdiA family toxin C-terminal domain-containing protein [Bacillus pseudomycoides]|uniref:CdiA family toxin C-terminal domain-containing protein n=1 Tax=Bacillus TaxID=1386 RepID=UPI0022498279|nr:MULTISPECIES: CdiA family toxin C-terminal domain-containing protein [Bacillus]MCX2824455.1 CdiA family toxin C-terminal domain-containing protein [Bacillus sp. DHT2]MDR4915809.1 CdiA family toxin C-terminal domain-containing protein [Bacillus pseudomycoides]
MAGGVDYVTATLKGVEAAGDGTLIGKQVGPGKVTEWVNARHAESTKFMDGKIQGIEASLAKGTDNLKFKEGYYVEHLTGEVEKCTNRHGVSGGHNYDQFKKYFDNSDQYKLEEVKRVEHSDIKGIYDIEYRLKIEIKDYRGQGTGEFKFVPKEGKDPLRKTVYDPSVISNEQIIKLGKEAMEDGLLKKQID